MIDPATASLICMLVMGCFGILLGWAAGNAYGYDQGYDDGCTDSTAPDWETSRAYWGLRGAADMGQIE